MHPSEAATNIVRAIEALNADAGLSAVNQNKIRSHAEHCMTHRKSKDGKEIFEIPQTVEDLEDRIADTKVGLKNLKHITQSHHVALVDKINGIFHGYKNEQAQEFEQQPGPNWNDGIDEWPGNDL